MNRHVLRGARDRRVRGPGAAAPALALFLVALAGCGGDGEATSTSAASAGEPGQSSPSAQLSPDERRELDRARNRLKPADNPAGLVRDAVKAVLTLGGPASCGPPLVTERYLTAGYGSRQGCLEAQSPGNVADRLDFRSVRVAGTRATAVVVPDGGPYDGERITVSLVRDSSWAVDGLQSDVPVGP